MDKLTFRTLPLRPLQIFFSSFRCYLFFPNVGMTAPGITTQIPVGQTPVGGATYYEPEAQGRASLNLWSAQCQDQLQRKHRTEHKGQAPSTKIKIKISDPNENRKRVVGLEGIHHYRV